MLKDLPKNTRITVLLEPYSSVVSCVLTFYAALYMQGNGLTARQIGLIAGISTVTGLMNQFLAAPITNRLGRRRTLLFFSIVCWSVPLLLWALATGFVLFLIAAVAFSFSRIAGTAWYCVVTEEVEEDRKSRLFGLLLLIAAVGGLATLLVGPMIERFGLLRSVRFLYVFAFVSMTLMFVIRHFLLAETRAGAVLNDRHAGISILESIRRCWRVVIAAGENAALLRMTLVYMLASFAGAMGFVQTLFLNNVLKLRMAEISMIPPITALVSVALYMLAVRRSRPGNEGRTVFKSLLALSAGTSMMLFIPTGHFPLVFLASALAAGGSYMFQVHVNAALNNNMGALDKAEIFSAVQVLVTLATIPAGYLAGLAFDADPRLPMTVIGLILLAAALLAMLLLKRAVVVGGSVIGASELRD